MTVVVAGLGWALGSAPTAFAGSTPGAAPAPAAVTTALVELGAAVVGAVLGALLGGAQALVLRDRVARPGRWVVGNALAWPPAMMIVFAGAAIPDEHAAVLTTVAVGTSTGALAGAVLGLITAAFLPRSEPGQRPDHPAVRRSASR